MLWWTLRKLRSKNADKRLKAAETLGQLRDSRAIEPLAEVLNDPWAGVDVHEAVIEALGAIGGDRVIAPLVLAQVVASNFRLYEAVERALARAEPNWPSSPVVPILIPALTAVLRDPSEGIRRRATIVLGQIGTEATVEPLLLASADSDKDVREAAISGLAKTAYPRAAKTLLAALRDTPEWSLGAVAEGLARIGEREAIEPLIELLGTHRAREKVKHICKALDQLDPSWRSRPAVDELLRRLSDQIEADSAPEHAVTVLSVFDQRAIEPLRLLLCHWKASTRRLAAKALIGLAWRPTDSLEHARLAFAAEQWEWIEEMGAAAVEPLVQELRNRIPYQSFHSEVYSVKREIERTVVSTLERVLATCAAAVPTQALQAVIDLRRLPTIRYVAGEFMEHEQVEHVEIDCSTSIRLAEEELARRNL